MLSSKTPCGKEGANKYYIIYVGRTGFKPLHTITEKKKLYTNHMNVLADNGEVLKYIEIWDKIEALFNKKFNNKPVYSNEYMRLK